MVATVNNPIVTDYVHAVKPPWLLLVLVGLIAGLFPRNLIPAVLTAMAVMVLACVLLDWLIARAVGTTRPADDGTADPFPFDTSRQD